jgi:hypothetical protein
LDDLVELKTKELDAIEAGEDVFIEGHIWS